MIFHSYVSLPGGTSQYFCFSMIPLVAVTMFFFVYCSQSTTAFHHTPVATFIELILKAAVAGDMVDLCSGAGSWKILDQWP